MGFFRPKFGCLYVATGQSYLSEACISAQRSRRWSSSFPIAIATDLIDLASRSNLFDYVIPHPDPRYSYRDKISPLLDLPFTNTLFLDSDAFLSYHLKDIFDYVQFSDLAAAFAPVRHPPGWSDLSISPVFSELNTGVIHFRRTAKQRNMVKNWILLYDELFANYNQTWDQASFRSVVWKFINRHNLKFLPLPSELNLRTPKPWLVGRGQHVYIIHGRFSANELPDFELYLNSDVRSFRSSSGWNELFPDSSIRPKFDNPA